MSILKNIKFIASAAVATTLSSVAYAQDAAAGAAATAPDRTEMWLTVAFYVLLVIAAGFILGIIGRILKVYDLTASAAGTKKGINWNSINASLLLILGFLGLYGSFWELGVHGKMILPEPASIHGVETDRLFHITFYITFFVFIVTHVLLFSYAYFYRQRKNRKALYYPHNDNVEKIWTLIPAIVLTVLVFFGWKAWTNIFSPNSAKGAIVVEAVGEQFKWTVRYAGKDNQLGKRNYRLIGGDNVLGVDYKDERSHDDFYPSEIVLPVGKPVQFVFGAKDVIHSAYMPHFRVQMNCVPGMPTYFAFTPTITTNAMRSKVNDSKFDYLLYCNKICGAAHYNMKFTIKVVSMREYQEWLRGQKPFYVQQQEKLQPAPPAPVAPVDSVKTADSTASKTLALNK
ncbi:cytochrome c oxidase subunit II [Solitalea koreensis]|uniref:Cytochrome c oxidase subunit 2 n=1 Tax=Solitalea koreensis TaxID=543615 RepID=A0A521AVW1_9SPHI|nr:cytochrome c oxidase subunit II [Solitalea koreensis]SMO38947.1 cytochrome c oxidase subunit 2 [Solitalea koreensis]